MSTMISPAQSPWLAHRATVREITPEYYGVNTYHLRMEPLPDQHPYDVAPGQFNMLYLPGVGEAAISVSGRNLDDDTWSHTVRTAGSVTRTLDQLGKGAHLAVRGPFGRGWPLESAKGHDLVFVAGGIGLAPLRPAIVWALANCTQFGRITLIYGARLPGALLYAREYDCWQQQGLQLQTTVDRAERGWLGNVGVVTLLVDRLRPLKPQQTTLFACGPEVMMRFVANSALARGIPEERLWLSLERNMQCAAGFCGHCQLGPAFVCRDGPVMRHDYIAPYLEVEAL
jgi:NAD(P)H-flavin reductase